MKPTMTRPSRGQRGASRWNAPGGRMRGVMLGSWLGFAAVLACGAQGTEAEPDAATPPAAEEQAASPQVGGALASLPMIAAAPSENGEVPSLAPVLDPVLPGVVNISVQGVQQQELPPLFNDPRFRRFFGTPEPNERPFGSAGSGVVVDAKRGLILTNHHVVAKADKITVTLKNGEQRQAELVGSDDEADVAVIRVAPEGLVEVPAGDSDALRVGDFVLAIGNPFGLGQTVTSGIVSALGRSGLKLEAYEDFIQTDASINPGNSGGALINLKGELVGINTAIFSGGGPGNIGIGFAIPANMARSLMDQIVEYGEVRRGQLGVVIQDMDPDLARGLGIEPVDGALISDVAAGSAAEAAGLEVGDVVVGLNGQPIRSHTELRNRVGLESVGSVVELEVIRDGKKRKFKATLDERRREARASTSTPEPPSKEQALHPKLEGVLLGDGGPTDRPGVEVLDVDQGSPSPLRPGDIVREVNRKPVRNMREFERAIKKSDELLLLVEREGRAFFIYLK